MELVYLWVQEYKNIHNQGFNFSPRFRCEYDHEKNELTIDENDYIENFFGENINVTAIVGKNGSGKSNILKIFLLNPSLNFFILYYDLTNNGFFTTGSVKPNNYDKQIAAFNVEKVFYSNHTFDTEKYLPGIDYEFDLTRSSIIKDISTIQLVEQTLFDLYIKNYKIEDNIFKYHRDMNQTISSNIFYKYVYSNDVERMVDLLNNNNLKLPFHVSSIKLYLNKKSQKLTSTKLLKSILETDTDEKILIEVYPSTYSTDKLGNIEHIKRAIICTFLDEYILANRSTEWGGFFYRKVKKLLWVEKIKDINELYYTFKSFFYIDKYSNIEIFKKFSDYFSTADKFLETCESLFERKNPVYEVIQINDIEKDFIRQYYKFKTPDNSFMHFSSNGTLSDGEKKYSEIFTRLFNTIKSIKQETILVLIDEGEVSLHPDWQKKYIDYLTQFFVDNFTNKQIHLIITTHSPFLLSDIPKQNIIFLEKDEDGNCKVVDGLNEKKETFGANIHILLSDSFFMEEGLMGEFAKSKINRIKNFYQIIKKLEPKIKDTSRKTKQLAKKSYLKRREKYEQIQSIIGEPFLQRVIKNYLEEIEDILFEDKAKEIEIQRFIEKFGKDEIVKAFNAQT